MGLFLLMKIIILIGFACEPILHTECTLPAVQEEFLNRNELERGLRADEGGKMASRKAGAKHLQNTPGKGKMRAS